MPHPEPERQEVCSSISPTTLASILWLKQKTTLVLRMSISCCKNAKHALFPINIPAVNENGERKGSETKAADTKNVLNLKIVHALLNTLVNACHAVFAHVSALLLASRGKCLTCHEWLLLQLYPTEFLASDVFCNLFRSLCAASIIILFDDREQRMSCFVDEAQVLLR